MNEPIANVSAKAKRRLTGWRIFILILILLFCVPIGWVVFIKFEINWTADKILHEADTGFAKAKKTIDPEPLRAWALEKMLQYPVTNQFWHNQKIPDSEIPESMRNLYTRFSPEDAFNCEDNGQKYVLISWGGPFFHWMYYVGPTNFTPPVDPEVRLAKWAPGIYYGREDTVHPIQ